VKIVESSSYARAGLLGNPSDGYFGKTIAIIVKNYSSTVVLYEWPELEIILSRQDRCQFNRIEELIEDVKLNGLYGGLRLIKAAIKVFAEHCQQNNIVLPRQNFALRYETSVPRQVGMAGSSAIITAAFRGMMEFYGIEISKPELANLVLAVETKEIGIAAGLQDRVCQAYEGLVYMDFNRPFFEEYGHGLYEELNPDLLPPLFLAHRQDLSQISGVYHGNLRERWERGDSEVREAMEVFARLAERGKECLLKGDHDQLAELINQNFDTRARLVALDPANVEMVELARKHGVCAKYAGSGGSIVGICQQDEVFEQLQLAFRKIGCVVVRPQVV
jgi:glucuronokinase